MSLVRALLQDVPCCWSAALLGTDIFVPEQVQQPRGMILFPNLFLFVFFHFGNSVQSLPAVFFSLAELLVLNASGQAGLLKRFWFPC